jgi:hypothetical protein
VDDLLLIFKWSFNMTISLIPAHVGISGNEVTGSTANGVTFHGDCFTFDIKFGS